MHGKEENSGFIVLKLDDGEDIMECLRSAVKDFGITSGFVIVGVGMLRGAEIGYFAGDEYRRKLLDEPHELLSLQGSITTDGETVIHLHCSLASPDHSVVGGHLFGGTVCVVNEILVRKVSVRLGRRLNPETGLRELTVG